MRYSNLMSILIRVSSGLGGFRNAQRRRYGHARYQGSSLLLEPERDSLRGINGRATAHRDQDICAGLSNLRNSCLDIRYRPIPQNTSISNQSALFPPIEYIESKLTYECCRIPLYVPTCAEPRAATTSFTTGVFSFKELPVIINAFEAPRRDKTSGKVFTQPKRRELMVKHSFPQRDKEKKMERIE